MTHRYCVFVEGDSPPTASGYVNTAHLGGGPANATTFLRGDGQWAIPPGGASLPAGLICMWSGLLANVPTGWALCDGTGGTPDLRDRFIKGWSDGVDPGSTGGAATHSHTTGTYAVASASAGTPTGTVSQPTFSGNALGTHSHGTGTYATSAHSGTAVADHASHTHTYTDVVNHVHTLATGTGSTGNFSQVIGTVDTSSGGTGGTPTQTALGTRSGNPVGGVATGTTAGPGATLTHGVTQPSAHTLSGSSEAVGAGTPSGTVTQPTFTGNALSNHTHTLSGATDAVNHEPAYFQLAYIMKL